MIISANKNKYSITIMCQFLEMSRSYYYKLVKLRKAIKNVVEIENEQYIDERIEALYKSSKKMSGSRKIAGNLSDESIHMSPYKVLKRMKKIGLSSLYHKRRFKPYSKIKDDFKENISNSLQQNFDQKEPRKVITSDLTYVSCKNKYLYICFVIDLYNREIIASGVNDKHDATFVYDTLTSINLNSVEMFHSDRGSEFINHKINKLLTKHEIIQSASRPGCPYDNAVSENLFGLFKREWMKSNYENIEDLRSDVADFVNNYNNFRAHSKLGYKSPVAYRLANL